ncbi:MAG: GtrA family protein [Chloroflexota bacterium]
MSRFLMAGGGSLAADLALQGVFIELAGLPVWFASGASYEIALLLHFLVINRWVFGRRDTNWQRLAAFQVTALTATAITYGVTNLLVYGPTGPYFADGTGPYMAKIIGTGAALFWTFTSSFFWIWRSPSPQLAQSPQRP